MRIKTEALYETYKQNVYAAAFSVCRNSADAEDVLQDTFLRYHSANKQFQNEQHIRAWLLRVAINLATDLVRRRRRRGEEPLDDYLETLAFPSQETSELFSAVMALPETYRAVIHLFYYEDYTVEEIASLLKLTKSNVKVRLSRGRLLLKESLKEAWNDDE
ncbi:MAG: sigma-70 family RNA polymerase sigma factor [Clostridia bacterium]|nr:sigma-70 family RNA polymerase sigma factor [Clostridia bacterium]